MRKGNDFKIFQDEYGDYAVFMSVRYQSGEISFWQQISKGFVHKKSAENYAKRAGYRLD